MTPPGTTTTTTVINARVEETSSALVFSALRARETGCRRSSMKRRKKKKKKKKKKKGDEEEEEDDDSDDDSDALDAARGDENEAKSRDDEDDDSDDEDATGRSKARPASSSSSPTTTLHNYVERDSLKRFTASYCPLVPNPRSTIANAYSSDGRKVASTHGDHTVKIIDVATGLCVKVLAGHRRTPWVVRFHPSDPNILASGSLDNTVRVWDISEDGDEIESEGGKCIAVRDFNKPIASIAFSLDGGCVLVASGHRLTYWRYPDYQLQQQQQQQQQHERRQHR